MPPLWASRKKGGSRTRSTFAADMDRPGKMRGVNGLGTDEASGHVRELEHTVPPPLRFGVFEKARAEEPSWTWPT